MAGEELMDMQQLVIPAKAGIQCLGNRLKILDSRFHGNDKIKLFSELLRVLQQLMGSQKVKIVSIRHRDFTNECKNESRENARKSTPPGNDLVGY
jgi:hypothetical protein